MRDLGGILVNRKFLWPYYRISASAGMCKFIANLRTILIESCLFRYGVKYKTIPVWDQYVFEIFFNIKIRLYCSDLKRKI